MALKEWIMSLIAHTLVPLRNDAARPAADALTAAEVEKMKVYDLKLALEARGLSTEGLKKVLKARLLAALG